MSLWNPANDGLLRALAEGAHAAGAAVLSQATHMGRRASSVASGVPLQAPSAVAEAVHREVPGRLHATDIDRIVACFAAAAVRLQACGWDGIEITSFGGHLIEQFWSPSVHRRTDRYRGSFENRTRFAVEVLEAIGRAVRDDFLVSFRMTADPATPELGLDPDDMPEIAARLDRVGRIDLFDISGGTGATLLAQAGTVPPDHLPEKVYNPLARAVREVVSAPVLVAGRILTPEAGEASLVAGDADLVAMTRAIIADPDLPAKTRRGERDRIRPCIAINESCIGRLYSGMPISCAVNPFMRDPRRLPSPAADPRRVLVPGGGPAGMEAARVASERGHRVELWERERELGGQVRWAARMPYRPSLGRHVSWLAREL
ncbi:MAG TPA: FAD-dependent oxidoreductase, partial [Candidatus Micrarchaeia archaeon]|nr:FAD-dependent oxidoreductase [Candidatus Micrarchaeia archaeon]